MLLSTYHREKETPNTRFQNILANRIYCLLEVLEIQITGFYVTIEQQHEKYGKRVSHTWLMGLSTTSIRHGWWCRVCRPVKFHPLVCNWFWGDILYGLRICLMLIGKGGFKQVPNRCFGIPTWYLNKANPSVRLLSTLEIMTISEWQQCIPSCLLIMVISGILLSLSS